MDYFRYPNFDKAQLKFDGLISQILTDSSSTFKRPNLNQCGQPNYVKPNFKFGGTACCMCKVESWRKNTHTKRTKKFFFFFFEKRQKRNLVVKKSKSGGPIPLI